MIGWLVLIYAVLVIAGGLMGYRAGSSISLIAGGGTGLLLLCGAALILRGQYQVGWWLSTAVALLLLIQFVVRGINQGFKLMPGGIMIILSLIVLAALLAQRTPASR